MMWLPLECQGARRELLKRDSLSAAARGRLDVHLKRCEQCRQIRDDLSSIDAHRFEIPELEENQEKAIYNGLIPVINEITGEIEIETAAKSRQPKFRIGASRGVIGALAACVIAVFALTLFGTDPDRAKPDPVLQTDPSEDPITLSSVVNRYEGKVAIDGEESAPAERFVAGPGTTIHVRENSRFSFHLGGICRVSMFGDAKWKLSSVTDGFVGIRLDGGRMAVDFDGSRGRKMEITTPDSIVRVKGTIFTVEVGRDGGTEVGVIEGHVEVLSRSPGGATIQVAKGEQGSANAGGKVEPLSDRHRSIAAEMSVIPYPVEFTKLVRFTGNPERVKVEVDGRVLGTTPLAVRLPDAPFTYRLTSPGMEPVLGSVVDHRDRDGVDFLMIPKEDFDSIPAERAAPIEDSAKAKRSESGKHRQKKRKWDLFKRARFAMRAGDLPYAIGLLEKAITDVEKERRTGALSLLAESYASAGMYERATTTYDRLTEVSKDSVVVQNARYEVGRLSMDQLGDLSRARAAFTAYVADPKGGGLREEAYYSLCELDGREGAHRDSLHCFNQFIRSFPGGSHETDARVRRGALYQDVRKDWKRAEADLQYFIKAKPHHPRSDEARYRLVIGRYQRGDRRGALGMIADYMKKNPNGQYRVRVERIRRAVLDSDFTLKHKSK